MSDSIPSAISSGSAAPDTTPTDLFIDGKIDAFLAGEPVQRGPAGAQDRATTIFNNAVDRPGRSISAAWSPAAPDYVKKYPIATKRVLRAILEGADLCVSDAPAAARQVVDRGYHRGYEYTLQTLNVIGYDAWRDHDAEDIDAVLRAAHAGDGNDQIEPAGDHRRRSTNWRFLNELKRELKT